MLRFITSKTVWGYLLVGVGAVIRARGFTDAGDVMIVTGTGLAGISKKEEKDVTTARSLRAR